MQKYILQEKYWKETQWLTGVMLGFVFFFFLFQILFPYRLLHNIEYSSLGYTVGACWLCMLNVVACIF